MRHESFTPLSLHLLTFFLLTQEQFFCKNLVPEGIFSKYGEFLQVLQVLQVAGQVNFIPLVAQRRSFCCSAHLHVFHLILSPIKILKARGESLQGGSGSGGTQMPL